MAYDREIRTDIDWVAISWLLPVLAARFRKIL